MLCIYFFFPETSHPGTKGIDEHERSGKTHSKWRPVILNPFSQLLMLRSPNVLAVVCCQWGAFESTRCWTMYLGTHWVLCTVDRLQWNPFLVSHTRRILIYLEALMVPLPYTIVRCPHFLLHSPPFNVLSQGKRYGIENEALIGVCFLPLGIGNASMCRLPSPSPLHAIWTHGSSFISTVGAPLSGWISDKIVIRYKKLRGYWFPEDRLRACLYSFYLPITVLASGLITKYIPGTLGLALNLICFFINGIGVGIFEVN